MTEHPPKLPPPRHVSIRALSGSILLILGVIVWFVLIWTMYGFSVAVGEFLEVVISLSASAA